MHDDYQHPHALALPGQRASALATQTAAIRVKVAELAPRADGDAVVSRLMAKVAALRRGESVIEIEPGDVSE